MLEGLGTAMWSVPTAQFTLHMRYNTTACSIPTTPNRPWLIQCTRQTCTIVAFVTHTEERENKTEAVETKQSHNYHNQTNKEKKYTKKNHKRKPKKLPCKTAFLFLSLPQKFCGMSGNQLNQSLSFTVSLLDAQFIQVWFVKVLCIKRSRRRLDSKLLKWNILSYLKNNTTEPW